MNRNRDRGRGRGRGHRGRTSWSPVNSANRPGPVRADGSPSEQRVHHNFQVRDDGSPSDGPFGSNDGLSVQASDKISMEFPKQFDHVSNSDHPSDGPFGSNDVLSVPMETPKQFVRVSNSDHPCQQDCRLPGIGDISSDIGKLKLVQNLPKTIGHSPKQISHKKTIGTESSENSECSPLGDPYDICPVRTAQLVVLKAPLLVKNRERRNEVKRSMEVQKISVLRSGMVLLKGYIDCNKQVEIVKLCRELGIGSGGFYQPGYRDGAKLNLKMMCLGKNWDPETSKYGDERRIDGAKPPRIPNEFYELVREAIQDSHAVLKKEYKVHNVVNILPSMQPNLCIVNFYTESGRLGLHQDKDESEESLRKGLPVVSFSIGDSAEFLYGDQREIDKAEKVILKSGDVLIFGGKSRHVFHGVTSILPNTSPKALVEATNLRAGRLNLTFREY